jgi:two-component system sensor histidine kinase RegB
MHGLANIIENASDFAKTQVTVRASWSPHQIEIIVQDDGPGFAPEIMERIGEPYITSRPGHYALGETEIGPRAIDQHEGMGLGFFIAKTLLEQLGATVQAENRQSGGARIIARWPRGAIDGENPPRTAPQS